MQVKVITGSITYALKGKEALLKNGYKAHIERKTGEPKSGCGYVVVTDGNKSEVLKIIENAKVKFSKII